MAKEIKMPQLSDTMDSGKILSWNKKEGDSIARGDILAEVETDKANLEIESFFEGVLLKIQVPANEVANVGEIIAHIGEAGEAINSSSGDYSSNDSSSNSSAPNTTPKEEPKKEVSSETKAVEVSAPLAQSFSNGAKKISPLAKKIANDNNLDFSSISGSGPDGRIVKKDVEAKISQVSSSAASPVPSPAPKVCSTDMKSNVEQVESTSGSSTTQIEASSTPLSKMRQTIANRMQQSVNEIPHFFTTTSINMSQAMAFRAQCKNDSSLKAISINHLIIKASAYALSKENRVNCSYKDGNLVNPGAINVGVVTAIEDGLLIPVIKNVNQLDLRAVAFETRAAIDRARAGRPSSSDLSGGTFTISNMGMFDVENFTAIISPGQGAILAVSSVINTPIATITGTIEIAPVMKVTLSVDHRVIDGTISSTFLQHFKSALECPALMLL